MKIKMFFTLAKFLSFQTLSLKIFYFHTCNQSTNHTPPNMMNIWYKFNMATALKVSFVYSCSLTVIVTVVRP